jgi:hypothetical protein
MQGEKFSALADVTRHCRQTIECHNFVQPHNPCSRQAIQPFVGGERAFCGAAAYGNFLIAFEIARRQGMVAVAFSLHAIRNAKLGQPLSGLSRTIGRVGV